MRFEQPFYTDPDLFLMADEDLIERSEGAKFHICQMVKESKPVLSPDKLWEGGDGKNSKPVHQDPLFGTVLFDPDAKKYVLWYNTCNRLLYASASGQNNRPQGSTVCMATSSDGLNWEKPIVGTPRLLSPGGPGCRRRSANWFGLWHNAGISQTCLGE